MFLEKYMIAKNGFRNVYKNGEIAGFQLKVNICYYHGVYLSLVNGFEITVDGEKFTTKDITFTVHGHTYEFDEMQFVRGDRWEFGEQAVLTVRKPGGIKSGEHKVAVFQSLNISYFPVDMPARDSKTIALEN